jgi:tungstate transport system substrate-binding protein
MKRAAAIALCLGIVGLTACSRAEDPLVLATTTSVGNSGLLDRILPGYERATVRALLVGSGRALDMLAAGTADVVISHAPARESAMLEAHPTWWYRKILFNDFVIVGPAEDPAGVKGAPDAVEAMRRIARSSSPFLSRGDESGTHERERELWSAARVSPDPKRLVIAGAGMGQTLRIASSTGGYTLTDRGTFEALAESITLVVLHEGDPRLLNTYAVIADPRKRRGAEFARWLADGAGRDLLSKALQDGGLKGFSLWPENAERTTPAARPH